MGLLRVSRLPARDRGVKGTNDWHEHTVTVPVHADAGQLTFGVVLSGSGGLRTMISGIGVFYPDKRPTQRIGIIPDVEAKPTISGIRAGRDEVLEVGIRQILGPEVSDEVIRKMVAEQIGRVP